MSQVGGVRCVLTTTCPTPGNVPRVRPPVAAHPAVLASSGHADGRMSIWGTPALDLVPALATRGIRIRVGIHTGECERRGDEWSGIAVHTGARIGALAGAGEAFTSRTVRDLSAGSGLNFQSLGPQTLKGLPEDAEVYRSRS